MAHKKTALAFGVLILIVVLLGGGYYSTMTSQVTEDMDQPVAEPSATEQVAENNETPEDTEERAVDPEELTQQETLALPVDLKDALRERVLGNPDAPVKISEHSSFSCGHCGRFHNNVFKDFKANWIDTGKAYLVFSDFPLNAPALHASIATRCISDNEQYFAAVEELFATQNDWAYGGDYFTPLRNILGKYGVDGEMFKACIRNEELQSGLLNKVRATQQQFGVNSTPTFVVNNAVTIPAGETYEQFNTILESAIAEANGDTTEAQEGTP